MSMDSFRWATVVGSRWLRQRQEPRASERNFTRRERLMSSSNCRNLSIVSLILTSVVGSARLASALNDPAVQFSPTSNPNPVAGGVWSYGYDNYTPPPGPFNLLTVSGS